MYAFFLSVQLIILFILLCWEHIFDWWWSIRDLVYVKECRKAQNRHHILVYLAVSLVYSWALWTERMTYVPNLMGSFMSFTVRLWVNCVNFIPFEGIPNSIQFNNWISAFGTSQSSRKQNRDPNFISKCSIERWNFTSSVCCWFYWKCSVWDVAPLICANFLLIWNLHSFDVVYLFQEASF